MQFSYTGDFLMAAPLLPANRTTPIAAWIAVRTPGSAANVLRGATVTDTTVNDGTSNIARRPPGGTTVSIARSQSTLSGAEASQANANLKLSPRA